MSEQAARILTNVYPRFYATLPSAGAADVILTEDDAPVHRLFLSDLLIFYAYDMGETFELVSNREIRRHGISADELHEVALQNLRALNLEVQVHGESNIKMLIAGGNFEATMLLLPEIWDFAESLVPGQVVAAVPARDLLIFTGDAENQDLAVLRSHVSKALEQVDKPLTRHFFRRVNRAWTEYRGFAE